MDKPDICRREGAEMSRSLDEMLSDTARVAREFIIHNKIVPAALAEDARWTDFGGFCNFFLEQGADLSDDIWSEAYSAYVQAREANLKEAKE